MRALATKEKSRRNIPCRQRKKRKKKKTATRRRGDDDDVWSVQNGIGEAETG